MYIEPYTAPIKSGRISVNDVGTTISWTTPYNYLEFLFDNQGSEMAIISIPFHDEISLSVNAQIVIVQAKINSITIKAPTGKTTTVLYTFQGYKEDYFKT